MYNPESEQIEYVQESIEDPDEDGLDISLIVNDVDITEHFDKEALELLVDGNELGVT
tara:strand:+ start:2350 stop:2520 length:171 start_codon:yes stop_codon:yes gene_type:complete